MSSGDIKQTVSFQTQSDLSGLSSLQASLQQTNQWLEQLNQTMGRSMSAQGQLQQTTNQTNTAHLAFLDTLKQGVVTGALFAVGMQGVNMALNLVTTGFTSVVGAAEQAISRMESFLQQSFQLADAAQQMEYLWQYQYGGLQGGGPAIASQISAWLPNFAMNSPYRLDQIMGAVGPLSQLGLSFQGLQRYLPLISDLSATHTSIFGGGGMLPIQYGALAVMEATKGYSRRLLMELQIRPNELEPYGLKFVGDKQSGQLANPEMFLPALEAYAKDKGYLGASKRIAHETWDGLYNSLSDRQMAFMRRSMGENIPDPSAGDLSNDVLTMLKNGDIAGAMKAVGTDTASLKSYGVTFGKNGLPTDLGAFQDALQNFSHDKFYSDWTTKGTLTADQTNAIKNGGWKSVMQQVGADKASLERYGATFDAQGNPIDMSAFTYALGKVSVDLHGNPEFKKGSIFSVFLEGLQDFSTWWDDHQSTFDAISKFIGNVGGQLLELGKTSISNTAVGLWNGFSQAFFGAGGVETWTNIGSNFMSWITDPRNQDLLKRAATFVGQTAGQGLSQLGAWAGPQLANAESWLADPKNQKAITDTAKSLSDGLGNAVHGLVTDLAELKQDWEDFIGLFSETDKGQMGDIFKGLGDLVGGFFQLIGNKLKAMLDLVDDILHAFKLLGEFFSTGHIDTVALMNLDSKMFHDLTSFITAGLVNINIQTYNGADLGPLIQARGAYNAKHPPKHGPIGGPTNPESYALGGSYVTQNNTYNIQGAAQWNIQALIDANAKKAAGGVSALWRSPGGLQYNTIGLF